MSSPNPTTADPETIVSEIREAIEGDGELALARARGKLHFHSLQKSPEEQTHSAIVWILRAQIGTMEKIKTLFSREGQYDTFELLAVARNLMENLVWLRLFNIDHQYGLLFYSELLKQQKQNNERLLEKVKGEIDLFEVCSNDEKESWARHFSDDFLRGEPTEEALLAARDRNDEEVANIDAKVRRSFCIYAANARFNGYDYQVSLLRTNELPRIEATIAEISGHQRNFDNEKPGLLTSAMQRELDRRWNWADRARQAGLENHYNFLYGYTSKLLHSTPLNLITEKRLSQSEVILLLEYTYVAVRDIIDQIANFRFADQVEVAFIDVSG